MAERQSSKVECVCKICSKQFFVPFAWFKKGAGKCCSRECARKAKIFPAQDRFWKFVIKLPNGCWEWTGRRGRGGYGQFTISHHNSIQAHRFSFEMIHGPIPEGLFACHKCDNPPCVNPDHLFLGTQTDNLHDAIAKGRDPCIGKRNGNAKLTDEDVISIRLRSLNGESRASLAREFGVTATNISDIALGKSWTHL